jgi:hypothetical protein
MDKSDKRHQFISVLMKEARHSMDHEHFEDAVLKLQRCLQGRYPRASPWHFKISQASLDLHPGVPAIGRI